MPNFGERLKEYKSYMDWDTQVPFQRILAVPLEVKDPERLKQTISAYINGTRTPTYKGLVKIADALGLSLDWLTGRISEPKWSPQILSARVWLRTQLDPLSDTSIDMWRRIVALLDLMASRVPVVGEPWFAAGVLGIPEETYLRFRQAEGEVNPPMIRRLSEFLALPGPWIMRGKPEQLTAPTDPGPWASILDWFALHDLKPEDVSPQLEWIQETAVRNRAIRRTEA